MISKPVFDLSRNGKQAEFFKAVQAACNGQSEYRYFLYGGAIRGGKTSVCLFTLSLICLSYPNMRVHVVRETFPRLKQTTVPSLNKLLPKHRVKKHSQDASNYYFEFDNGSQIIFFAENYDSDKDLDRFKGLETNIFFLEQIEELREETFDMCIQRVGSWYIDPMPPPLILATFNPTHNWVKEKFHDKYKRGELNAPFYYKEALTKDNPFVTAEQWAAWENLDRHSYSKMIEGDWEAVPTGGRFVYSFDPQRHITEGLEVNLNDTIYLAFDFNVNPITCLICQHNSHEIRIIEEFRLIDSNIHDLCELILDRYPNARFSVTGDAAGRNRSALVKGGLTYYTVISSILNIHPREILVPKANPSHINSRNLTNALFDRHPKILVDRKCKYLIEDLIHVKTDENGGIDKKRLDRTHLLDCLRYYFHTYHNNFVAKIQWNS